MKTTANANKEKQGRAEALALAKSAKIIHVAKGKKVVTFDMKNDPPDDETLLSQMLGPTGNLRAPTIKRGSTIYVGFNEEGYRSLMK